MKFLSRKKFALTALLLIFSPFGLTNATQLLGNIQVKEAGIYRIQVKTLHDKGIDVLNKRTNEITFFANEKSTPFALYSFDGYLQEEGDNIKITSYIEFVISNKQIAEAKKRYETLHFSDSLNIQILVSDNQFKSNYISESNLPLPLNANNAPQYYMTEANITEYSAFQKDASGVSPWIDMRMMSSYYEESNKQKSFVLDDFFKSNSAPWEVLLEFSGASDNTRIVNDHIINIDINNTVRKQVAFGGYDDRLVLLRGTTNQLKNVNNINVKLSKTQNIMIYDRVDLKSVIVKYPKAFNLINALPLVFDGVSSDKFVIDGLRTKQAINYISYENNGELVLQRLTASYLSPSKILVPGMNNSLASYFIANNDAASLNKIVSISKASGTIDKSTLLGTGTQYIAITASKYVDNIDLSILINHRINTGLSARILDVQDIYNNYSSGIVSTTAIDEFVSDFKKNGGEYVLLVGHSGIDPLNYVYNEKTDLPSPYEDTIFANFSVSDAAYADTDNDFLPDIALGRFPVKSAKELSYLVNKTINYNGMKDKVDLIVDADDTSNLLSFDSEITRMAEENGLFDDLKVNKIFYDDINDNNIMKNKVIDSFTSDSLSIYYGHALISKMGYRFDKTFIRSDDLLTMPSTGKNSVIYALACDLGDFSDPNHTSVMENAVLNQNGAVAVISSTTLVGNSQLQAFTNELFKNTRSGQKIGDILVKSKNDLAQTYYYKKALDILNGVIIIGDPALVL